MKPIGTSTILDAHETLMTRFAAFLVLSAALGAGGCASSPIERAGSDQEIVRDILVELGKDSRFDDVQVTCIDRVITLKGRVSDRQAVNDAFQIARGHARGATVLPRLIIREK